MPASEAMPSPNASTIPHEPPRAVSASRHSFLPPRRGSSSRLKRTATRAHAAPHSGPRKRSRNAIPPTAMWTSLRSTSPVVRREAPGALPAASVTLVIARSSSTPLPLPGRLQPGDRLRHPLSQRAWLIAARARRGVGAVGPVVMTDLDEVGSELRRAAEELRPRAHQPAHRLGEPAWQPALRHRHAGEPLDRGVEIAEADVLAAEHVAAAGGRVLEGGLHARGDDTFY